MSTVNEQIENIVTDYTEATIDEFSRAKSFADLGIDSLSIVEIVFDIEEAFDIKIPNESELEQNGFSVESYTDILKIVHALLEEKQLNE